MRVLNASNIDAAYADGMWMLAQSGVLRETRNGPALVMPEPVTTHYHFPHQRVLFNAKRDANPFFHLFEAMWMLDGGNDISLMKYFVARMADFSDDGITFHGAYGYRWRHWEPDEPTEPPYSDQLDIIVRLLKKNPDDRRVVLQMWNPALDLGRNGKDIPCNLTVKFEVGVNNTLNMIVFNRSNDIIWGCFGANAVHFSFLQEYIASRIGVGMGWYEQVSTNFHAYNDVFIKQYPVETELRPAHTSIALMDNPDTFDQELRRMIDLMHLHRHLPRSFTERCTNRFFVQVCAPMADAYLEYKTLKSKRALEILQTAMTDFGRIDWLVAGHRWLSRRNLTNV